MLDLAHHLGETLVHPLQRAQKRADFVGAADVHRMTEFAVRNALRHLSGMPQLSCQRADQQAVQQSGHRHADGQQRQQRDQHQPAGAMRGGGRVLARLQCLGEQIREVGMQRDEGRLDVRGDLQLGEVVLLGVQLLERIVDRLLGALAMRVGHGDQLRLLARETAGQQLLPAPLDIQAVGLDLGLGFVQRRGQASQARMGQRVEAVGVVILDAPHVGNRIERIDH